MNVGLLLEAIDLSKQCVRLKTLIYMWYFEPNEIGEEVIEHAIAELIKEIRGGMNGGK